MTLWFAGIALGSFFICFLALKLSKPKAADVLKNGSFLNSKISSSSLGDDALESSITDNQESNDEAVRNFGDGEDSAGGSGFGNFGNVGVSAGIGSDEENGGGEEKIGHAIAKPNAKAGKVAPGKKF